MSPRKLAVNKFKKVPHLQTWYQNTPLDELKPNQYITHWWNESLFSQWDVNISLLPYELLSVAKIFGLYWATVSCAYVVNNIRKPPIFVPFSLGLGSQIVATMSLTLWTKRRKVLNQMQAQENSTKNVIFTKSLLWCRRTTTPILTTPSLV